MLMFRLQPFIFHVVGVFLLTTDIKIRQFTTRMYNACMLGGHMMTSDNLALGLLQNALTASSLRQSAYANNIANADTPGYKAQSVEFESLFQNAMTTAPAAQLGQKSMPISLNNSTALLNIKPEVVSDPNTTVNNNGNNVDIASQMAGMAENQLRYNALSQDMSIRFTRIENVLTGV